MILEEMCQLGGLLLVGRLRLLLKELSLNVAKEVRISRLTSLPLVQVTGEIVDFLLKGSRGRARPTLLCNRVILLFQQPLIFKMKGFSSMSTIRI
jgi:hypothetical protein